MGYNSTDGYLKILDELIDEYYLPANMINKLMGYMKSIYRSDLQNNYSAPMLWIGMYIALASLVCILAMVADLLHGLRSRRLWFPCRYFKLNAAFLAVISVAMKLPVDLSGSMPGDVDQVAKLGSMAFMCTIMANLLPCLATMGSNELLSNVTGLCIFVITMVVNVCIQISTGVVSYKEDAKVIQKVSPNYDIKISKHRNTVLASIYVALSLVLLMVHVCSSLAILKSKKIIESKYQQRHERASKKIQPSPGELLMVEKLQEYVRNHWIMAGSGSPQFITACFRTTSASGVICVLVTILHTLTMSWTIEAIFTKDCDSDYGWSMIAILIVQFIGGVVVVCKIIALIPFVFMICLLYSFRFLKWLPKAMIISLGENTTERNKDLRPYVLCLEDEMELGERTLESLSKSVNEMIQKGEKRQPENLNLRELIQGISNSGFQGLAKFDHIDPNRVPSLGSTVQYHDSWSLPVVTLTTIAVSLRQNEGESLFKSVREGLVYVNIVEECLNVTNDHVSIRKEAETLWKEVEVEHKWLGHKFQDLPPHVKTARQIVEWFRDTTKTIDHEDGSNGEKNDDSRHRSICANSMYHITKTMLIDNENIENVSHEQLFKDISSTIADIIAACLTNLPQVITMKCHTGEIEKREAGVKDAALLLGETKEIIDTLYKDGDNNIPCMNPSDLPFISNWRAHLRNP
ncbi:hypothetical protein HanXRQr2_Chr10g0463581 [Helianthus annuus]|uniref:Uncharacterized protein n=1 Tax=Helianthus annuus TaxID=4232 RepID=A0A9K3I1T1_HELAN|nr:hypothetical protein HanXRQr2_Chr10g0463581 [Helianthus annuus]KAJ0885634.1 hypothetical protein HanPSC8_Chr10g0447361 [Helianthus annuus]